jgi:hypothetical protein
MCLFTKTFSPDAGSTLFPTQWVTRGNFPGVKVTETCNFHSSAFNIELKIAWSYTSNPSYVFMVCNGANLLFTVSYLNVILKYFRVCMLGFEYYLSTYRAVLLRLFVTSSRDFSQLFQVTFAVSLHSFSNSVFNGRSTMRRFTA